MSPRFYMPIGLPGCGKSTYAADLAAALPDLIIISSDKIREELWGDETIQGNPGMVFDIARERALEALKAGKSVYFDATNLKRRDRGATLSPVQEIPGVLTMAIVFSVPVEVAIQRNNSRARKVPEDVIRKMADRMELPSDSEGFNVVEWRFFK